MTKQRLIKVRHSREGGNPGASIWHVFCDHFSESDNQIILYYDVSSWIKLDAAAASGGADT
jgi:hypothetical protein